MQSFGYYYRNELPHIFVAHFKQIITLKFIEKKKENNSTFVYKKTFSFI